MTCAPPGAFGDHAPGGADYTVWPSGAYFIEEDNE